MIMRLCFSLIFKICHWCNTFIINLLNDIIWAFPVRFCCNLSVKCSSKSHVFKLWAPSEGRDCRETVRSLEHTAEDVLNLCSSVCFPASLLSIHQHPHRILLLWARLTICWGWVDCRRCSATVTGSWLTQTSIPIKLSFVTTGL